MSLSASTVLDQYVRNINSKVTVIIDKNSQISDDRRSEKIEYTELIPVGGEKQCRTESMLATSTTLTSTTKSLRMLGRVEQIPESRGSFCGDCGLVKEPLKFTGELPFQTGCNSDICQSDLGLELNINQLAEGEAFVIGSSPLLSVVVTVQNTMQGEPAYLPRLTFKYPKILELKQELSSCNHRETPQYGLLACSLPGPILPGDRQRSVSSQKLPSQISQIN